MTIDRRTLLVAAGATLAMPALARTQGSAKFPKGFLWGAATAGHQVEGNNVNSDLWLLENIKPTVFTEPSGDAVNSFELWRTDLDLVKSLGLNSYRFSLEWARIEPEPGRFSIAMLDHYKAMIDGCHARGLTPMVTFNHFTSPRWFAAAGGWTNPQAPELFARFCDRAARHLAGGIGYAMTLNEPNLLRLLRSVGLPAPVIDAQRAMLAAAAKVTGTPKFGAANVANAEDVDTMLPLMIAGHKQGKAAIKAVRPDLPVGVTLAIIDEEAVGPNSKRDAIRADLYGAWLEAAKGDDFIGVQNYERSRIDANGRMPAPAGSKRNFLGSEVHAPSLAGAVRYAHRATGLPVIVTEHGVGTDDDTIRAELIPAALKELKAAMDDGVPVKGYVHWSLLDNFEWVFGYRPHFGLVAVDRKTFRRTPKPSAAVYAAIAKRNAL
ncbi:family 1 glycosylhydrolase [Sphingomonas sp. G-3-2-10]|uniref:glycoside hydrolase family 1 protein n=1 Tax=Sphingomonas sp. G-3-2-10 TaxID=2728838 RepID=UPI00146C3C47|nr:family 1 glycosylhydrolase [Sphingomonas sp. G-3-2-10]NML05874.1 glycoside hydrolase family 1 protein [Sphingomonas sp. G-3-2-10]